MCPKTPKPQSLSQLENNLKIIMVDSSKKITSLYLKTHTQKFDLLTIFLLDLSKKGIGALGSIVECTNLLMLDVSYNGI